MIGHEYSFEFSVNIANYNPQDLDLFQNNQDNFELELFLSRDGTQSDLQLTVPGNLPGYRMHIPAGDFITLQGKGSSHCAGAA